ncbi:PIG-P-domain-containing protein [Rickenella mellea]|uniref:PIG-P-domain-containing protein n=1 Tax=Rickenella mellea TaxID=50990 RepID=A0A4Y7QC45_9AGAM|nr:PIG-P-domain-containing protein [Rickenella mellea]
MADGEEREPTSPLSPVAPYPRPPIQRSRAPEFYGFVGWISTSLLFFLYIFWAILPEEWLEWLGITWYPSREWAILVPAYSVVLILLTYFTYWALAIYSTPPFNDLRTVTGPHSKAHFPDKMNPDPYLSAASPDAIPEMYDIPIGLVNRVLYGERPKGK